MLGPDNPLLRAIKVHSLRPQTENELRNNQKRRDDQKTEMPQSFLPSKMKYNGSFQKISENTQVRIKQMLEAF